MENGNTKQQILDASLELFAIRGFEATSVSQIADAVGIRKASLYSHFANKQDILDSLVASSLKDYNKHSIFANANWDDPEYTADKTGMNEETVLRMIQGQVRYIIHDPKISMARKMLVIEQFQNPELAKIQTKQNYSDVLNYYTGLIGFLTRRGVLRAEDTEIMAAQFCHPITVWINLCDREPEREEEVMNLIGRHVHQFFCVYAK